MGKRQIDDKVKELASFYYKQMVHAKRDDGSEYWSFRDHEGADADRCTALSRAAHGSMFPDDFRYEFLREALSAIEDADDLDEIEVEADIYTHELTAWLGSRNDRVGYCDDAASEGLISDGASMFDRMSVGQYMEKREVLDAVREHLRDEAEELIDAEESVEEASA